jgi:ubiquinone/menaquinone biosynthesis C-methylase UbiE
VLDRAQIGPDDTVVDVDTGPGLLARGALGRIGPNGSVVALDSAADCLEQLRRECDDPRVSYLVGSADVLPLPDGSVDIVIAHSMYADVSDRAEAARELFRVLRSGGRMSIFEPVESAEELDRIHAEAGFTDVDPEVAVTLTGVFLAGTKP